MIERGRRLRISKEMRGLVKENVLTANDSIFPIFVVEGNNIRKEMSSLPGNYHISLDRLNEIVDEVVALDTKDVIIFGLPEHKDACGLEAYSDNGIVQKIIRKLREDYENLLVTADACMCEHTSHGHCGIIEGKDVNSDETLSFLDKIVISHAKVSAHVAAPSDMMDGRTLSTRNASDEAGFVNVGIMSHSAKYCLAFYGPFREAANSASQFGDRRTYQTNPANSGEAIKEVEQDIEEGVDVVMAKPALSYLDIVKGVGNKVDVPVCVYNVSGELAMVKATAKLGLINEKQVALEILLSMKRAGADMIIIYCAIEVAGWLQE